MTAKKRLSLFDSETDDSPPRPKQTAKSLFEDDETKPVKFKPISQSWSWDRIFSQNIAAQNLDAMENLDRYRQDALDAIMMSIQVQTTCWNVSATDQPISMTNYP